MSQAPRLCALLTPRSLRNLFQSSRTRALCGALCIGLAAALPAWAQQPPAAPAAGEALPPNVTPLPPAVPNDPAARAVIESQPTTPLQILRAGDTLSQLGFPENGRVFLQQWLALPDNTDQTKAEILDELGTAFFLRLRRDTGLAPEAAQVADAVLEGADRYTRDPQRLATLIARLSDPVPANRRAALRGLLVGREAAVAALVSVLGDPTRGDEHAAVQRAIVPFGSLAFGPLLAGLDSSEAGLRTSAVLILAEMQDRDMALYVLAPYLTAQDAAVRDRLGASLERLFGTLPSAADAEELLFKTASLYFARKRPLDRNSDGLVTVWVWDAAQRAVVAQSYPVEQATVILAARLAKQLHSLAPANAEYRNLYLASLLESAVFQGGLDKPLATGEGTPHDLAVAFSPADLEEALVFALGSEHLTAAAALASVLGEVSDASILVGQGAAPRPLVQALQHGDRRLKFAALQAIMKLRPTQPFAGSSFVPETLGYFANSTGRPRALVAHPNLGYSQQLAGALDERGYETETATTGYALAKLAAKSPDFDLVMLSLTIDRPAAHEVIVTLRSAPKTATIPIALLIEEHHESEWAPAQDDPLTVSFPWPLTDESIDFLVGRMNEMSTFRTLPADVRARQTELALTWLAELSGTEQDVFSLRKLEPIVSQASHQPKLAPAATQVLASLGTHTSQVTLLELASTSVHPLESRQAAAAAFARSVERFGIRLTSSEILAQYDRYNQSARADAATQQLLGNILDALESKTAVSLNDQTPAEGS